MESLEEINKKLFTSRNVKKLVVTMKALAATNAKIYDKAMDSLAQYKNNIEFGIQAILSAGIDGIDNLCGKKKAENQKAKAWKDIVVIFGSNQGLCGKFNDKILNFFAEDLEKSSIENKQQFLIIVGNKLKILAENYNFQPDVFLPMPNALEDVLDITYNILNHIEQVKTEFEVGRIFLYYAEFSQVLTNGVVKEQLLPVDETFLRKMEEKKWPVKVLPFYRNEATILFSDLMRQYVFSNLYYMLVSSLLGEQKYRLASLQGAEKNITDLIKEMEMEYSQRRQGTITSELLDVISGYRMLQSEARRSENGKR